jgi:hypothetical protein
VSSSRSLAEAFGVITATMIFVKDLMSVERICEVEAKVMLQCDSCKHDGCFFNSPATLHRARRSFHIEPDLCRELHLSFVTVVACWL